MDAKSGLSGAGKALSNISHYVNVNNNYTTYKLNAHQHIPEIIQALKFLIQIYRIFSFLHLYYHLTEALSQQFIVDLIETPTLKMLEMLI